MKKDIIMVTELESGKILSPVFRAEFPLVWDEDELEYQPATFDYTPVWSAI